jgi:hypothetical protein
MPGMLRHEHVPQTLAGGQKGLCYRNLRRVLPEPWLLNLGGVHGQMKILILKKMVAPRCHTRFSKEQNQANHMCAQEVHTYARMKKNQKQCYYITYT